jgi:hypothetical protein
MAAGLGFKDFVTGEVLTAADVDGYLMQGVWVFASATARDAAVTSPQEGNFAYLKDTNVTTYYTGSAWANLDTTGMTNPMTTTGDTIYSSSGSTPARLGIGTAGQVLQVNSGATAPEWATPAGGATFAGADVGTTGAQTLTTSTGTFINFDAEVFDIGGYHDNVTNNSRFTVPAGKAGYYLLVASINFASSAAGLRYVTLYKNGSSINYSVRTSGISGAQMWVPVSGIAYGAVGDYFQVEGFQSSGGNLTSGGSEFGITYLGA